MSKIIIKDAVKKYGNNTVIPDLNATIRDGELFTLLGPSGCGKTTLLRMDSTPLRAVISISMTPVSMIWTPASGISAWFFRTMPYSPI